MDSEEESKFVTILTEDGEKCKTYRASLKNEKEAEEWVQQYGESTFTSWIVQKVDKEENCTRMVMRKKWSCQLNKKNKLSNSKRNVNCQASINIKIKKLNRDTKKNDKYLCQDPPLQAVITLVTTHNHNVQSFDAMKFLRASKKTRDIFRQYFESGHGVAASIRIHEAKLEVEDDGVLMLGNSTVNPLPTTVEHWYRCWKELHYGMDIDPISKLQEKIKDFEEAGAHVRLSRDEKDPALWAVLVVTPIASRMQQSIDATGVIFLDSTGSCDVTESTLTPILAATPAGAIPIAIVIHNSQTTEGYRLAFKALKDYNVSCFGSKTVPEAFMTDNSPAEKGALKEVWPDVPQLLCHFHVGQAEWRWLCDSKHGVEQSDRVGLMRGFQEIMYSKDSEQLEEAVENFKENCKHEKYLERVEEELENKEEWVSLFRDWYLTRGHNTNNFSEANIRILKDIVLERLKALNPVALVDFIINVWEIYFRNKLLKYAYNRMPGPYLKYDRILKRLDPKLAEKIVVGEDNVYYVPSGTTEDESYEVMAEVGLCTCYAGRQGAFCKHQALVHKTYGGLFPNAPAVTSKERYALGKLALGEKCPAFEHFKGLKESFDGDQLEMITATKETESQDQLVPQPHDIDMMETDEYADINSVPHGQTGDINLNQTTDDLENLIVQLRRVHMIGGHQSFVSSQVSSITKKLSNVKNEGQVARVFHAISTALTSSTRRKRGMIRVQPTSVSRRREGAPRGAKRLPAGRPASNSKHKKKRPHSLAQNIRDNLRHAR